MKKPDTVIKRPIQNLDLAQFQSKVSEFLTQLTGKPYSVDLLNIDFEPKNSEFFQDRAEITLRLETNGWVFYSKKEKEEKQSHCDDVPQPHPEQGRREAYKISRYSTDGVDTLVENIPTYEKAVAIRSQMYEEQDLSDHSEFLIEEY